MKIARQLGVVALAVFVLALPGFAQVVTFQWEPHPEAAQLAGFKLYTSKVSGSYAGTAVATFTGGTLTTGTIPTPSLGRHYFVLRAFVNDGTNVIESDNSNEVSLVLKPKPPKLLSAIQAIASVPAKVVTHMAEALGLKPKGNLRVRNNV